MCINCLIDSHFIQFAQFRIQCQTLHHTHTLPFAKIRVRGDLQRIILTFYACATNSWNSFDWLTQKFVVLTRAEYEYKRQEMAPNILEKGKGIKKRNEGKKIKQSCRRSRRLQTNKNNNTTKTEKINQKVAKHTHAHRCSAKKRLKNRKKRPKKASNKQLIRFLSCFWANNCIWPCFDLPLYGLA